MKRNWTKTVDDFIWRRIWNRRIGIFLSFVFLIFVIGTISLYIIGRSSPNLAINGSYTVIGLLVGLIFSIGYSMQSPISIDTFEDNSSSRLPKLTGILLSGIVVGSTVGVSRDVLLLTLLPLSSFLIVLQIRNGNSISWSLLQIVFFFIVNPLSRFLSTGYFFGNGDLLVHTPNIQRVMQTGTTGPYLVLYQQYPGYFFEMASVGHILGVTGYSALQLTGSTIYGIGVLLAYVLATRLSQNRLFGISVALAFLSIRQFYWYANYHFPQAYAVILILLFFTAARIQKELALQSNSQIQSKLFGSMLVAILLSVMYIHHLGVLVSLVLLAFLLITDLLTAWSAATYRSATVLGWGYAALLLIMGLSRWTTTGSGFLFPLSDYAFLLLGIGGASLFFSDGGSAGSALTEVGSATLSSGIVATTVYPPFVYFVVLVSILTLSGVVLLIKYRDFSDSLPYILTGIIISPFILPTPLSLKSIDRLRLVLILSLIFFIGCGLFGLIQLSRSKSRSLRIPGTLLIVCLIVAAPLASSTVTLMGPVQSQSQFSATEYSQIEATTEFVADSNVHTDWLTGVTMNHFRQDDFDYSGINVSESNVSFASGSLVYRNSWSDYRVSYRESNTKLFSRFVISQEYLDSLKLKSDKIYASGGVGVLQNRYNNSISN
ncbi:hypothetical protein [Haloferax sulfurifontis]|uniref:hypothetical protein n=1 Tax=Haloferax sulfurifontis TaxID=255616 RepID=UPI001669D52C|nr:hypothetical protein [Haloferax sulfurifontis]